MLVPKLMEPEVPHGFSIQGKGASRSGPLEESLITFQPNLPVAAVIPISGDKVNFGESRI